MNETNGKITGFWHTGITVSDMESALVFYRDGLGLEVEYDRRYESSDWAGEVDGKKVGTGRVVFLRVPGSDAVIELWEYEDLEERSVAPPQWMPGSSHICLLVEDADAVHERVEELGFTSQTGRAMTVPAGGDFGGDKFANLIDADGYVVVIYERAKR